MPSHTDEYRWRDEQQPNTGPTVADVQQRIQRARYYAFRSKAQALATMSGDPFYQNLTEPQRQRIANELSPRG